MATFLRIAFNESLPESDHVKLGKVISESIQTIYEELKEAKEKGIPLKYDPDRFMIVFLDDGSAKVSYYRSTVTLNRLLETVSKKLYSKEYLGPFYNKISRITLESKLAEAYVPDDKEVTLKKGEKWAEMHHNGIYLGQPYEYKQLPFICNGKPVTLTAEGEDVCMLYASRLSQEIASEQKKTGIERYTLDWPSVSRYDSDLRSLLPAEDLAKISPCLLNTKALDQKKELERYNEMFSKMVAFYDSVRDLKTKLTEEEKKTIKMRDLRLESRFGMATIDGRKENVGNWKAEPPSLFFGRGKNPVRGCVKKRMTAEDVTINLGENAPIPTPSDDGKWKEVVHDHTGTWIAKWHEVCSDKLKYSLLSASSKFKVESNRIKFEKARYLRVLMPKIVDSYTKKMASKVISERQLGTVVYLIDNFAFRIGNEKKETEADTVGASTLKVSNVKARPGNEIEFDFLGKDSIQYKQDHKMSQLAYDNIVLFTKGKNQDDLLFDQISGGDAVNKYLKSFMGALSAKVIRTYRASETYYNTIQNRLSGIKMSSLSEVERLNILRQIETEANKKVAELCNHQKKPTDKAREMIKKLREQIEAAKVAITEAKTEAKIAAAKKKLETLQTSLAQKEANLTLSCTTSKQNYIDPRIAVSFAKKYGIEIAKIYPASMQKSFQWAILGTEQDWDYMTEETEIAEDELSVDDD